MWRVAAFLAISIMMIVIEVPSLMKSKKRRELWTFFILLFAGLTLGITVSLGVEVQTPLEWIKKIYGPISKGG
ncbi:hypothetical protein QFZ77_005291 [Paenibacillus sp. V4I3]|uniref:hypothetical protein n=1 Tax=unclassified Paenibacillus TaxID=185978 RepID=UPI00278BA277|nr:MULTISPECIES: hypothetical protein [unclassified Paenibacillus]MDQ0876632.1 hypothetical protein [Paenibacillus sp. V4I3]MDQ0887426.1 hypothetical protein [Paenibacillus sp. V4I9]